MACVVSSAPCAGLRYACRVRLLRGRIGFGENGMRAPQLAIFWSLTIIATHSSATAFPYSEFEVETAEAVISGK